VAAGCGEVVYFREHSSSLFALYSSLLSYSVLPL
jgi:hypothetical protein